MKENKGSPTTALDDNKKNKLAENIVEKLLILHFRQENKLSVCIYKVELNQTSLVVWH